MSDVYGAAGPSVLPPTPNFYPYIGMTPDDAYWFNIPGFNSYLDAVLFYDAELGGVPCFRTFSSGAIGTWTSGKVASIANNTNGTVHHSFKTFDTTAITAWMNGKPDNGLDAFLTYYHEPEDNFQGNPAAILDWQQKTSQLIDLRDATGRTDIKCGPVLQSAWTLNPNSGRNYWRDWYVGPPIGGYTPSGYPTDYNVQDFYGWDPYNGGWNDNPPSYVNPTSILDGTYSIVGTARVHGQPLLIGEMGSPRIASDTDGSGLAAHVAAYIQACVDYYLNEGIKFLAVLYWSDGYTRTFDSSIWNETATLEVMSGYCANSRSFYGITGG